MFLLGLFTVSGFRSGGSMASSVSSIMGVNFVYSVLKGILLSFLLFVVSHGLGVVRESANLIVLLFLLLLSSEGTSEDILVFLLWEVDIIVPEGVRLLDWVIFVILPQTVRSQVSSLSVFPSLQFQIAHRSALVVCANGHCSLVGFVVNNFSSQVPLLFLLETFEDVVWADLHDVELVIQAMFSAMGRRAELILSDFSVATFGNVVWLQSQILSQLHRVFIETTLLGTEGLTLSVGVPVIMSLIMLVVLVE